LRRERGLTYLFVSHDLNVVRYISDRVMVMYLGQVVEIGNSEVLFEDPRHPYTRALLQARPRLDGREARLSAIPGQPASGLEDSTGCAFAPRCRFAIDQCRAETPLVVSVGSGGVRCLRADEDLWGAP